MNFKELAGNIGMEEEEYLEIVELFVETGTSDLDKLQSAIEKGAKEEAANVAHSLKGASGNLGFTDFYEAAKLIEQKARSDSLDEIVEDVKLLKEKLNVIAKASAKDG
jgi:HPt (histidine-containing phosphotransfer) domain-containing protein